MTKGSGLQTSSGLGLGTPASQFISALGSSPFPLNQPPRLSPPFARLPPPSPLPHQSTNPLPRSARGKSAESAVIISGRSTHEPHTKVDYQFIISTNQRTPRQLGTGAKADKIAFNAIS